MLTQPMFCAKSQGEVRVPEISGSGSRSPEKDANMPRQILIDRLLETAQNNRFLVKKPELRHEPWTIGLVSAKGNVRSENQDFCFGFRIDDYDVLLIADGCGGHAFGAEAATIAVCAAAGRIISELGMVNTSKPELLQVAQSGFQGSADFLKKAGEKNGIQDICGGMRTTLILIIADKANYGYLYIGDGGGWILRENGICEPFLTPQKEPGYANVLRASLGPVVQGEYVTGTLVRESGDLLLVGTDGIFDRVQPTLAFDAMREAILQQGNLQNVAENLIQELAEFQDQYGFICDDNMTLGLLGNGCKPQLAPDFWANGHPEPDVE